MNYKSLTGRAPSFPRWFAAAVCIAALAGCGREEVKVYQVAKDQDASAPASGMPPGHPGMSAGHSDMMGGSSSQPQLTWKTPAGWDELPGSDMRAASFKVKGKEAKQADISIIPLAGTAGGDFPNVNRWRNQVGLPPLSDDELKKFAQKVQVAGESSDLYDLPGHNPETGAPARIISVIRHRDGTAWFFKMSGEDESVAQQKDVFVDFLKSVSFDAGPNQGLPPSHPPIDSMTSIPMPPVAAAATEGQPKWQVPAGWKEVSAGQFLAAKFIVDGSEGGPQSTAVNVSTSAGDGGGLGANVNRWRQQLGLKPASDADLASAGSKGAFIELSGTDGRTGKPAQIVGTMVSQAGQTWFYKLMGDPKVVEAQKGAFTQFVESVKY